MVILACIVIILILIIIIVNNMNSITTGRGEKDTYPYKHLFESFETICKRMKRLSNYKTEVLHIDYKLKNVDLFEIEKYYLEPPEKTIFVSKENNYELYNDVSDYYTEYCRIRANMKDQPSVWEWWNINKNVKKYKGVDPRELHEMIYVDGPKQLTNFKPTNLVSIIDKFKSTSILDFSAGWGDRLVAVLAKGQQVKSYVGVDPNPCLHPLYKKICDELNVHNVDVQMIESPFETAIVPHKAYDLVFTSPPYFDLEVYSDVEGQSHMHGNLQMWYDNFLMVSLKIMGFIGD